MVALSERARRFSTRPAGNVSAQPRRISSEASIRRALACKMAAHAFGGESNRGERILDFVRHSSRYLAPGGLLLSFEQVG